MTSFKVRADGVVWQEVDDELIVLDETRSVYLKLVGTGSALWPALVRGSSVDDLVDELCGEFEVDADTARSDAIDFVKKLVDLELVVELP